MSVIELRQYTLVAGQRETLIELFEAEFVESQEACGMRLVGTFRDLDDESKFVWLRSFPTIETRAPSLRAFYGGPAWARHRAAANATMVDSDDVLLLKPWRPESDFARRKLPSRSKERDVIDRGVVEAGIVGLREPASALDWAHFEDELAPRIEAAGASVLACLITEHAANDFPVLPVREGENVVVWLAGFPTRELYDPNAEAYAEMVAAANRWPGTIRRPQILHLMPTKRSWLIGTSASPARA
jgi:hypothetical protein